MRAVQYQPDGAIRLVNLPIPTIGPGELLVRIAACGVCAAEVLEWYMRSKAPIVLGHEPAGTIVRGSLSAEDVPDGVRGVRHLVKPSGVQLVKVARLIDAGHVRPFVKHILPLSAAAQAHGISEQGHTRGKIVLEAIDADR